MNIQKLVQDGMSTRQIAKELNKSQTSVRYNLKKLNLKTNFKRIVKYPVIENKKICSICGIPKDLEDFYNKYRGKNDTHNICKVCSNKAVTEKMIQSKIKMIEYKGGKCERCGISLNDSHYCIFDFHHKNPLVKDKNYSSIRSWNWERIKKEIDGCSLLCSNCHRLEHVKIV